MEETAADELQEGLDVDESAIALDILMSSNVPRWSRNGSRCIQEGQDIVWCH